MSFAGAITLVALFTALVWLGAVYLWQLKHGGRHLKTMLVIIALIVVAMLALLLHGGHY